MGVILDVLSVLAAVFFVLVLLVVHASVSKTVREQEARAVYLAGEETPLRAASIRDIPDDRYLISLCTDLANENARILFLDNVLQGYIDLEDPTNLRFAYTKIFGMVADIQRPAGEPINALSLGGGTCTMASYIEATRPNSLNDIFEADPKVAALAESDFGVVLSDRMRMHVGDAPSTLSASENDSYDVVFGDLYTNSETTPRHLRTPEFLREIKRVLRRDGVYAVNIIDYEPYLTVRSDLSSARHVFEKLVLIWPEGSGLSSEGGSFVILMGRRLDTRLIERELRARHLQGKVLDGAEIVDFINGAQPSTNGRA